MIVYDSKRVNAQVMNQSLDGPVENAAIRHTDLDWLAFECSVFVYFFEVYASLQLVPTNSCKKDLPWLTMISTCLNIYEYILSHPLSYIILSSHIYKHSWFILYIYIYISSTFIICHISINIHDLPGDLLFGIPGCSMAPWCSMASQGFRYLAQLES